MSRLLRTLILCLCAPLVPAAGAEDTFLYIVDVGPNREAPWQVLKVRADGTAPEVFIDQELSRPQDILFLEDQGTAIVSNLRSGRITAYDAESGTYRGDFATGIGEPTRMAFGPEGLVYVLQWRGNGRVLRYEPDGAFVDEFSQVGVTNAIGMDWDAEGNLYVASFDGRTVRRFGPDGADLGVFASANLRGPTNLWFNADGELWVLDWTAGSIRRYDADGDLLGTPVLGLSEPEGVEFLDNGNFLVGNGGTSSVKEYDAAGNFVRDLIPSGLGGLAKPNGLRLRTVNDFTFNPGLNDAWFNPETAGQGALVTIYPELGRVFIALFTYDVERPAEELDASLGDPGHRWITAFGDYAGDAAVLEVTLTTGGVFDSGDPSPTNTGGYGTLTLTFAGCNQLELGYDFPNLQLSGLMPLQRIVTDNVALCEALAQDDA